MIEGSLKQMWHSGLFYGDRGSYVYQQSDRIVETGKRVTDLFVQIGKSGKS